MHVGTFFAFMYDLSETQEMDIIDLTVGLLLRNWMGSPKDTRVRLLMCRPRFQRYVKIRQIGEYFQKITFCGILSSCPALTNHRKGALVYKRWGKKMVAVDSGQMENFVFYERPWETSRQSPLAFPSVCSYYPAASMDVQVANMVWSNR
jgi:hypothetical protein